MSSNCEAAVVSDHRAMTTVTVLIRPRGWENEDLSALSRELQTAVTRDHHRYPEFLILRGATDKETVAKILGLEMTAFGHKNVLGMDNPILPFVPHFRPE